VAEFSSADAAFTGFRIVWERPISVVYWALLRLAVSLSVTLFITLTAGAVFTHTLQSMMQFNPDPAQTLARLATAAPTLVVGLFVSLVLYAVLSAAINRAVLRPEQFRFGYLRLASDELRQLGLFGLMVALAIGAYLALLVAVSLVVTLLAFAIGDAAAIGLGLVVLLALSLVGLVFAGVRLSLASPRTFDTGRIDLLASWQMTRGRFWPLFWTYLLAFGLWAVVQALILAIGIFGVAIIGGGFEALGAEGQPDFSSFATALAPMALVNLVVSAIGEALSFPVTAAPPASIYRVLTGGGARAAGKVFD
jgi:hypothetical protein